jgi:uncharacterized protein
VERPNLQARRISGTQINSNNSGFMGNNNSDSSASSSGSSKKAFTLSPDPVVFGEGEVHKFEVAPEPVTTSRTEKPEFEDLGELPASYAEDMLFLVARDPRWLFSYWDFDWSHYPKKAFRGGLPQFFLKILKADGAEESVVEIKPEARNWYVPVQHPNTSYVAEIGFYTPTGTWHTVVASGITTTPGDSLAADEGTAFATVPAHLTFERLLELLKQRMEDGESLIAALARIAGEGQIQFRAGQAPTWTDEQKRLLAALLGDTLIDKISLGSEEIDQLLRKQLQQKLHSESASLGLAAGLFAPGVSSLYSGIGASWSAQPFSVHAERGFFMHVNAEIIFYGGTHPDATVWVDGKEIALAPDGTFRYHFKLPDGDFAIPIVAQSPDKFEQRTATLSFVRGTAKVGKVDDTAQPENLGPLIGKK